MKYQKSENESWQYKISIGNTKLSTGSLLVSLGNINVSTGKSKCHPDPEDRGDWFQASVACHVHVAAW